jgi:hypothetical protein
MERSVSVGVEDALLKFVKWLDEYGETSFDHQSFFAGGIGGAAKALYYRKRAIGTLAVSPMILCEALWPSGRRLFGKPMRFPIADAHYASGFAFLATTKESSHYARARHFLEMLIQTRSPYYAECGWGYPFDWVTSGGTIKASTPLITTLPYVYEAFGQVYRLDGEERWRGVMRSIAEHAFNDYGDLETSATASSCSYTPSPADGGLVVNASAYRAFLLTEAGYEFNDDRYRTVARRNLNFVLESQNEDGSWFYSMGAGRDFVDHFHTCFVLKALAKIHRQTGCVACWKALERGVSYYLHNLFDANGLPKPFSRAPRMTVYRHELYDYAECINICVLLQNGFPELNQTLAIAVADVLQRWRRPDGSFRSRKLRIGWDDVPMHRWAQSQLFRSLSFLLSSFA